MLEDMLSPSGKEGLEQDSPAPAGLWQRLELRLQPEGSPDALWPALQERLAGTPERPRLRGGLVLKLIQAGPGPAYLLSDPMGGRYFRLGEREALILSLLDGEREVQEIVRDCSARFGPIAAPAVEQFLQDIRMAGLLEERTSLWKRLGYGSRSGPLILWTLPAAEDRLRRLYRRLRFLFHPLAWAVILALFLGAVVLLVLRWDLLPAALVYLAASWWWIPLLLLALYLAFIPVALTHEGAHALTCIHFGGRVSRLEKRLAEQH